MPQQKPQAPTQPWKTTPRPAHLKVSSAEWKRLVKLHHYENEARQQGFARIAGVDEAGRGPLAGPVVAAACVIPEGIYIAGVNDSKLLTPMRRKELFFQITEETQIEVGIGIVSHGEIDAINIFQATKKAMLIAVSQLTQKPDILLVDGLALGYPDIPCQKIVGGDRLSHAIAAASVVAKETRDGIMCEMHVRWPHYGFDQHKGYGTEKHLEAIRKHGPCEIHRLSFKPFAVGSFTTEITESSEDTETIIS